MDDIENLLRCPGKESTVNYLHKKKTGKEMLMSIQIGDYEVNPTILDLASNINILTKQTWEKMGQLALGWSPV